MRIETEMPVGTGEDARTVKLISLVTETSLEVFTEAEDGSYTKRESMEIKRAAALDAKVLWGQLDLLLYLDSRDLRCTYTGVMTRDKEKFVTAEAAFRPGRELAEPRRLYFDTTTALIERIDVFDAKSNMRLGTTMVGDYKDHEGIKFPELIEFTDRAGEVLGGWRFSAVKVNPEVADDTFLKP
jgi:hypothetical protein